MANTNVFPASLNSFTRPGQNDNMDTSGVEGDVVVNTLMDAQEAIEAKVGSNGSGNTNTFDYKLSGVSTGDKVVSLTGTETLTNKTITNPTITGATISSPTITNPTITGATFTSPTLITPQVDTINESTAGNGVVVDGVKMKDETILLQDSGDTYRTALEVDANNDFQIGDTNYRNIEFTGNFDGWFNATDTWTYASASTFTIADVDRTDIYKKGLKIKWTDGGGTKYGVVASSAFTTDTTVTIQVNNDYVIANSTITANQISHMEPGDFPSNFEYTPALNNLTLGNGTISGQFNISGKQVTLTVVYTQGSTSMMGTDPEFDLPLVFGGASGETCEGTCTIRDAGSTTYTTYNANVTGASNDIVTLTQKDGTNTSITSTTPMTWATGDFLRLTITYYI